MIEVRPYDDLAAMSVLSRLDPWDLMEAEAVRGAAVTHLALFADWRALQPFRLASWVILTGAAEPFALLSLTHTGQAGVAQAAFLARDHRRFRRELVEVARRIRTDMPAWAAEMGVARIEARAWARHPRASAFLTLTGFAHEADLPGFGPAGAETFRQFAWTDPAIGGAESRNLTDPRVASPPQKRT